MPGKRKNSGSNKGKKPTKGDKWYKTRKKRWEIQNYGETVD